MFPWNSSTKKKKKLTQIESVMLQLETKRKLSNDWLTDLDKVRILFQQFPNCITATDLQFTSWMLRLINDILIELLQWAFLGNFCI